MFSDMTTMTKPKFVFDNDKHEYRLNDRLLPSVTEILRSLGFINPAWYTEEARSRGKAVHVGCHYLDEGKLDWSTLHPDLHGYVKSWEAFKAQMEFKILDMETPRYHPLYQFAGTLDRRVVMPTGREWIFDLKTGKAPFWAKWQTAAYDLLADADLGRQDRRRACVELHEDGSLATMVDYNGYENLDDRSTFLAFMTTHYQRIKHCLLKMEDTWSHRPT